MPLLAEMDLLGVLQLLNENLKFHCLKLGNHVPLKQLKKCVLLLLAAHAQNMSKHTFVNFTKIVMYPLKPELNSPALTKAGIGHWKCESESVPH